MKRLSPLKLWEAAPNTTSESAKVEVNGVIVKKL